METKYTIYEVLEILVERANLPSEQQKLDMLTTIRTVQEVGGFGVMATLKACIHPEEYRQTMYLNRVPVEVCGDCGRKL